jgi:hypothetical protein
MVKKLTGLVIDEVSLVDKAANDGAKVMFYKRYGATELHPLNQTFETTFAKVDEPRAGISPQRQRLTKIFEDIFTKGNDPRSGQPPNAPSDAPKAPLSAQLDELVAEMIAATGDRLHPDRARRWILHTTQGQALLAQHTKKKEEQPMPQVDIMKLIGVIEDGLMAQVTKRDGESYAKSFSRKYENDIDFRKQWCDLTDAKHSVLLANSVAMSKGMASLEPTSTVVGSSEFADDSAEAVRLLQEMAAKNGRSFEAEFGDPANSKLAARTYTAHHSSVPYHAGSDG